MDKPVEFIEKNYPATARSFKAFQREQYELFCKKQMDYGPGNIAVGTSLETDEDINVSLMGLTFRMNDKMQRLINLVVKQRKNAQNESVLDSFDDLSVYGIIARIVNDGFWGK
jgi:hypothetical protein